MKGPEETPPSPQCPARIWHCTETVAAGISKTAVDSIKRQLQRGHDGCLSPSVAAPPEEVRMDKGKNGRPFPPSTGGRCPSHLQKERRPTPLLVPETSWLRTLLALHGGQYQGPGLAHPGIAVLALGTALCRALLMGPWQGPSASSGAARAGPSTRSAPSACLSREKRMKAHGVSLLIPGTTTFALQGRTEPEKPCKALEGGPFRTFPHEVSGNEGSLCARLLAGERQLRATIRETTCCAECRVLELVSFFQALCPLLNPEAFWIKMTTSMMDF